jgi:hypothetical protein
MPAYRAWLLCVLVGAVLPHCRVLAGEPAASSYREVEWTELVPASWHPETLFEGLNPDELSDDDPRAIKALEALEAEWKNAPTNPDLQGRRIRIPGYVAPLDWEGADRLKEFLLVPYFGACIHVPPPPANQIIYITMDKELAGIGAMDTVWVYGVLEIEKNDSGAMGAAGYGMRPDKVELYE